ncbi:MAG: hypothetical protein SynsKO_41670 [Synoicihabitans sp.]
MVLFCLIAAPSVAAPKVVESQQAPDRPYRIFVGLDVKLFHEGDYRAIKGITNRRAFLVGEGDPVVNISRTETAHFEHTPKVAGLALNITDVDTQRDYSIIDRTSQNWMGQRATVQNHEVQNRLTGDLNTRGNPSDLGQRQRAPNTFYNPQMTMEDRVEIAQNSDVQIQLDQEFYGDDGKQQSETKTALIIEATVSSPEPIVDAFGVGFVRAMMEGRQADLMVFGNLGPLGPEPRRVRIRKEELALKMEVLEVKLHVYREGHELVSNLSEKQFPVTRDELHEYVSLAHMADHRDEDRPAEPEWSLAPPALLSAQDPSHFDFPAQVAVDERGRVTHVDENIVLPEHIQNMVTQVVFKPALSGGTPVASTATVNLSDYFR